MYSKLCKLTILAAAWFLCIGTGIAQPPALLGSGVSALGCSPSNNGTGHMVCAETIGNSMTGVSWLAPPNAGTINNVNLGAPAAPANSALSLGQVSCGSANDGSGSAICGVQTTITNASTGQQSSELYGVMFYPPANSATSIAPIANLNAFSSAARFTVAPSCVSGTFSAKFPPPANQVEAICAVVAQIPGNRGAELLAVAFNPTASAGVNSGFVSELSAASFSGVGCTTIGNVAQDQQRTVAACAVNQAGSLRVLAFDPRNHFTSPVVTIPGNFIGSPACAAPSDNSNAILCIAVNGTELEGIAVNPFTGTLLATQNLGTSPAGSWTGQVSCSLPNETNNANSNTALCISVTNADEIFTFNFDPRTGVRASGVLNGAQMTTPSCLALAIDKNQMSCGTSSNGTAFGFNIINP
ncbi:MAG TPA: hypothetical protein VKZ53_08265 [Candidatus Angelobacter sp.]|nr:hypothetical protein [Candidatus Angelobacter sp.]